MGDFLKGRLDNEFVHPLKKGIVLHRRIDMFAQHHPAFIQSRHRISRQYGLYRGAMVDLFYDHFLAIEWMKWSNEPLKDWLDKKRKVVEAHLTCFPERLQAIVPVIFHELIPSYLEIAGIGRALERMSRRVKRRNPLAGGESELVLHYEALADDFRCLLPDARQFVESTIAAFSA